MGNRLLSRYQSISIKRRATVWFFVCSLLQRGISTITTPIFTRLLSTEEYGQYSVFNSWMSIVQIIVTLQLCSGVYTMGIVKFKDEEKEFTSSFQGLNLTLCVAWTIIYLIFHNFWNNLFTLTTPQMLCMLVMIWSSAAFNFWMTTQRNQFRYRALVIVTLITSVLKPVLGIILVVNSDDKVTARIFAAAIVELVCYCAFFVIQMAKGKKFFSWRFWKYAVRFNLPLVPHYLSQTVLNSSDRIMIQRMVGESEAGIYGLAYSISLVMTLVNNSLNKVMSPVIYQSIRDKKYRDISNIVFPSLILVAAANLALIAIGPEVISVFAPAEYYEAIYVIPPVAMSALASYMYLCFAPFEFYYEKRAWTTISTLTSAVVNILLNIVCIHFFGYIAAGYTTLICQALSATIHYNCMRRVCKRYIDNLKPYNLKILLGISAAFLVLGFIYIPLYSTVVIRYAFTAVLIIVAITQRKRIMPLMGALRRKGGKKSE